MTLFEALSLLATAAAATAFASPAAAQQGKAGDKATPFTFSANYDYTRGTYGTTTNLPSSTLSVGLLWDINDNWNLDIDLPYLRQTAPVVTKGGTVRVVRIGGKLIPVRGFGPVTNLEKVSGQGDATATLIRSFDSGAGPVWSAGAKIKFATASAASGLGTGKNDYSLQAGVINDYDALTVSATAGYTFVGRVTGIDLRNSAYVDLDASYKTSEHWSLGANLSASRSPVAGTAGPLAVSASANYKFRPGSYLTGSLSHGLSDASPKWGLAVGVNLGF